MKFSFRLLAAVLGVCTVLSLFSCASSPVLQTEESQTQTETGGKTEAAPELPPLTGQATITGNAVCDETVTCSVKNLSARTGELCYRWYLDGEVLPGATDKKLVIPVTAAGKSLSAEVFTEETSGTVKSEAIVPEKSTKSEMSFAGLWYDVKKIGRVSLSGSSVAVDWTPSGVELHVQSTGGNFTVHYSCGTAAYFAVNVDGQKLDRFYCLAGKSSFSFPLGAGEHTVTLLKDSSPGTSKTALDSVEFAGTLLEKPADKAFYIEFIGDSIACGSGSLGRYKAGEAWKSADHSGTNSFCYFLSSSLDADYSVVAKGGIGLLKESDGHTMPEIYEKTAGLRDSTALYDFARVPDLVILELGANDSAKTYSEEEYFSALSKMVKTIREKYGEKVPIVWVGKSEAHFASATRLAGLASQKGKLFAFQYTYGGSGSAALATQSSGHPNSAEQKAFADAIEAFLRENKII